MLSVDQRNEMKNFRHVLSAGGTGADQDMLENISWMTWETQSVPRWRDEDLGFSA